MTRNARRGRRRGPRHRPGPFTIPDEVTRTLEAVANELQVVLGVATDLHRSMRADAREWVALRAALDRTLSLLRSLQPRPQGH